MVSLLPSNVGGRRGTTNVKKKRESNTTLSQLCINIARTGREGGKGEETPTYFTE